MPTSVTPWTPWHKVVTPREDVRTGELSLTIFAADLYDAVMGQARPVYQDPREFFALTYPCVSSCTAQTRPRPRCARA